MLLLVIADELNWISYSFQCTKYSLSYVPYEVPGKVYRFFLIASWTLWSNAGPRNGQLTNGSVFYKTTWPSTWPSLSNEVKIITKN